MASFLALIVSQANTTRNNNPYIILGLPFAGLFIVFLYRICKNESNIDTVMKAAKEGERIPLILTPLIMMTTFISHLFGASVGRLGAAFQIGGSLSNLVSKIYKLSENTKKVLVMSGMSASFSAIFGTPVAATVFPIAIMNVGTYKFVALVPCLVSAIVAGNISIFIGNSPESFFIANIPDINLVSILKITILAIICGLVSMLFCKSLHKSADLFKEKIQNPYLRIFMGGSLIVILTFILGTTNYLGGGQGVIRQAFLEQSNIWDFALKILFTCISVGVGFKGGEIMPSLFVGSTLGSFLSIFLGLPVEIGAGCGLIAVFCGVTNAPLASIFLAVELMGTDALVFFAISCVFSYFVSGYYSLYKEQTFEFSKYGTNEKNIMAR